MDKIKKSNLGGYRPNSGRKPTSLKEKMIGRWDIDKTTGCWLWNGHTKSSKMGYGRITYKGKYIGAHRASYILANGDIDDSLCVCHKCDNPTCVNPLHLFLGTYQDNIRDMHKKGRAGTLKGELAINSKLTTKQVLTIRREYTYKSKTKGSTGLAKKYNVSPSHILAIVKKRRWAHVA